MPHDEESDLSRDIEHLESVELDLFSLRFRDQELERSFRESYLRDNVANLRFAMLAGIFLWIVWGVVVHQYLVPPDRPFDLIMRYGVFIPLLVFTFCLSFTPFFYRIGEWTMVAAISLSLVGWLFYLTQVIYLPHDYGYVGLILITAFAYALARLRFWLVMLVTLLAAALYIPYAVIAIHIYGVFTTLATTFILSFAALFGVSAYRLEKSTRLLYLRERQLQYEHARSEGLLLNILPRAIVDRLKRDPDERVADDLQEVSVVFADAVDSTTHAAMSTPEEFAETLDQLFRRFDEVSDRHGLEKIKTIGDAYMGVAGAPVSVSDHAARTADAAMEMMVEASKVRWPSGDPVEIRVGMATGPAVAGVIGQRKFAYDLWGDTVNLASRLEENGETGRILVSERMARKLEDRFEFGRPEVIDLKGKGPTPVRFLVGRRVEATAPAGSRSPQSAS
jgi:class 3 adenylate cyclase